MNKRNIFYLTLILLFTYFFLNNKINKKPKTLPIPFIATEKVEPTSVISLDLKNKKPLRRPAAKQASKPPPVVNVPTTIQEAKMTHLPQNFYGKWLGASSEDSEQFFYLDTLSRTMEYDFNLSIPGVINQSGNGQLLPGDIFENQASTKHTIIFDDDLIGEIESITDTTLEIKLIIKHELEEVSSIHVTLIKQ